MLHGGPQLLQRGRLLLQRTGLLGGALGQVLVASSDLHSGVGHALAATADAVHYRGQLLAHGSQRLQHLRSFVAPVHLDRPRQVSAGHALRRLHGLSQRRPDAAHQRHAEQQREQQPAGDGPDGEGTQGAIARLCRRVRLPRCGVLEFHQGGNVLAYRLVQRAHGLQHQGAQPLQILRAQCCHGGHQPLLHETLAVLGETLGQRALLRVHGAALVGGPNAGDGGNIGLYLVGAGAHLLGHRCYQGHGQRQPVAQQQPLDLADLLRGREALLVQHAQCRIGLGGAPQAHEPHDQNQQRQGAGHQGHAGGNLEAVHAVFSCLLSDKGYATERMRRGATPGPPSTACRACAVCGAPNR